ncbi:alanine racemase [Thermaerobacter sp. PB12/4term]|nr:alanine racemase [Thermaerobacter sp. PB12/4term]
MTVEHHLQASGDGQGPAAGPAGSDGKGIASLFATDTLATWPDELAATLARARIEVDLDMLAANLAAVRRFLQPGTRLLAVVKGDGYGVGAEMAARTFAAAGADALGTATLESALRLRRSGITAPILVFQPPEPPLLDFWLREGLQATVHDAATLHALSQRAVALGVGRPLAVHLEVDMGLGRGGLAPGQVAPLLAGAASLPGVRIEGLYTHLPTAARPRLALRLLDRFLRLVRDLEERGLRPPLVHCAESHLLVLAPYAQLDMVRVGNLLYGYAPRAARRAGLAVRPPSRLVVRVWAVHRAGDMTPGYRGGWARPGTPVAVLPVGLADGLRPAREARHWGDRMVILGRRLLGALGARQVLGASTAPPGPRVRAGHREVPLRGEFMMNHCLFDATGLPLAPGQEVELLVSRLTAPAHLPVVYLRGGRPVAVAWPQRQVLECVTAGTATAAPGGTAGGDAPAAAEAPAGAGDGQELRPVTGAASPGAGAVSPEAAVAPPVAGGPAHPDEETMG